MKRLLSLVRKHHCVGTHQCFAVDALGAMRTDEGKRLAPWILCHFRRYLDGAVDPDIRFRDYHNHLLHVRDGFWGGAPRVAHQWYDRLIHALRDEHFDDAAHAAGVLSHYITDVIFPLHTISTPREALIHRPLEWSIENCYDRITDRLNSQQLRVNLQLSRRPGWLGSMMMHAARFAERRADPLVKSYGFPHCNDAPSWGLDDHAMDVLAELFALSIGATAGVLCRAAAETEAYTGYPLPECGNGWTGLLKTRWGATATVPYRRLVRWVHDRRESYAVKQIVDEYLQSGQLREHLPDEIDIKRRVIDIHRSEIGRRGRPAVAA